MKSEYLGMPDMRGPKSVYAFHKHRAAVSQEVERSATNRRVGGLIPGPAVYMSKYTLARY